MEEFAYIPLFVRFARVANLKTQNDELANL